MNEDILIQLKTQLILKKHRLHSMRWVQLIFNFLLFNIASAVPNSRLMLSFQGKVTFKGPVNIALISHYNLLDLPVDDLNHLLNICRQIDSDLGLDEF